MIKLGMKVKDRITGFQGVVTGIVYYISGCNQALVVPAVAKDNSFKEGQWFDLQRLKITDSKAIKLDNGQTPGPDKRPLRNS